MRVRVLVQRRFPEKAAPLQLFENDRVRFLYEHSAHERHVRRELAAEIDGLEERESIALPRRVIVGAERWRHVHDAGSFVGGDE